MSKLERRVPEYNKSMLEKNLSTSNVSNNIRSDEFGDRYYSTGKGERNPTKVPFSDEGTPNIPTEDIRADKQDESQKPDDQNKFSSNPFIPLNDINFNESKNIQRGKEVLLNEQNISHNTNKYRNVDTIKIHPANGRDDEGTQKLPAPKRKEVIVAMKTNRELDTTGFSHIREIGSGYFIQAGVYRNRTSIDAILKRIASITTVAVHKVYDDTRDYYKIMLGPFGARKDANEVISKLVENGYYDVIIVQKWR